MKTVRVGTLAVLGYVAAAIGLSWPLPMHLGTTLPGPVGGDTGVYVWNLWLFRHEILVHHRLPYFTNEILSLNPPVDLSLHNYTVFSDLLAFPLVRLWGPVVAYNLVLLTASVLAAIFMFVLARRCCRSAAAAWLAGLLFAWSPTMIARGEAHLSLVNVAALPAFVLAFERWWRTRRIRDAFLAGVVVAWAVTSDPYYGVYCLVIAAALAAASSVRITRRDPTPAGHPQIGTWALNLGIGGLAALVITIVATGGFEARVLGVPVKAYTLYTPVLALSLLCASRIVWWARPRIAFASTPPVRQVMAGAAAAGFGCVMPLLPFFIALRARVEDGGRFHAPTLWRSSPPGVDLLSLVAPNPNSAFVRGWLRPWFEHQPGGFAENVASITTVAIVVVVLAMWRYRFRPSKRWTILAGMFALTALGPFVHIAGVNTYIPGPWAFLRYVPLVASARMPARFAAPLMMAVAIVFAQCLAFIAARNHRRRIAIYALAGIALVVELAPVPRPLYDARIPEIYKVIAADPRPIRVMELPLGFRDGETSYGNFTAASQFYQTFHGKRLIGGYLSRISQRALARQFRFPVVRTITRLSEGAAASAHQRAILIAAARRFADRARLGYVVIDTSRTPPGLRDLAIEAFGLTKVGEDRGYELYRVPIGALALGADDANAFPAPVLPVNR